MDLRELQSGVNPAEHWYYRTKRLPMIRDFDEVSSRRAGRMDVVDIGAGSGFFSEVLLDRFADRLRNVVRVDTRYTEEARAADSRLHGGFVEHVRTIPRRIENAFVLVMDVVEHVPDDVAFLRSVTESCAGPTHVFVTAPAFPSLWSGHDEFLGHHRRYTLGSLRRLCEAAHVTIDASYYLFGLVFPLAWAARRLSRGNRPQSGMRPTHRWVNDALSAAGRWEASWCRRNRLAGVTAVVEGSVCR